MVFSRCVARVEELEGRRLMSGVAVNVAGNSASNSYVLRKDTDGSNLDVFVNSSVVSLKYQISQIGSVTVSGAGVDNTLTVDFSNGDPFPADVSFGGGGGLGNSLIVTGMGTTAIALGASSVVFGSTAIDYSATQSVIIKGGPENDTLNQMSQPGANVYFDGGAGNDLLQIFEGSFTLGGDPTSNANLTVQDNSALVFSAGEANQGIGPRHLAALNIGPSATATMEGPLFATDRSVLVLGELTIGAGGMLNLGGNDMIVHHGNVATLSGLIPGSMSSSSVLGILQNVVSGAALYPQFDLQTVVATDVLVKSTVPGDANLDGVVNGADYQQIDHGFAMHRTGWQNGDFNGDGVVNSSDYAMIDNAFNQAQAANPDPVVGQLQNALAVAGTQLKKTVAAIGTSANYPQYTNANGSWSWVPATQWTAGFFPGALWAMYQATGDSYYKTEATKFTGPLSVDENGVTDVGFQVFDSFNPLLAQDPGNGNYIGIMLKAAASKATQFNPTVGAFKAWDRASTSGNSQANFPVLMDLIMDSNLMFWAAGETGNQTYYNEALQNAITEETYLVRPDGGSAQFAYFNSTTGQFIDNEAYEGYSSTSTWSRGEAWGIYGLTLAAQQTGRADFLATAEKMADYFLAHLPADHVPYWDFNDPAIPNAPRDTSAAAVAASGMLQLSKLIAGSDPADAVKYRSGAGSILSALASSSYLANPAAAGDGILLHGALNVPANPSIADNSLIFGDYYFLQGIDEYLAG